ncbi:hypothetical protein ACFL2V_11095 [Pseudomonadota bacterium]
MPNKRLIQLVSDLPLPKKILGAGTLLMIISLFLPWYQDKDTFNTGVEFSGLSGPLFLMGLTLLALSILSAAALIMGGMNKKVPFLPFKASALYLFNGLFSFYVLLIANSVYFHQNFGLNITFKQSRFGMFFAFIAASLITIGGYLDARDKGSIMKEFNEDIDETFIKVPEQEKPKVNIRKEPKIVQPQPAVQQTIEEEAPLDAPSYPIKQEASRETTQPVTQPVTQPAAQPTAQPAAPRPTVSQPSFGSNQGSQEDRPSPQPFRTDL